MTSRSFNDMSLFDDIKSEVLRARNRGIVMANIAIDGRISATDRLDPQATADLLEYYGMVPESERKAVWDSFFKHVEAEGFKVGAPNA